MTGPPTAKVTVAPEAGTGVSDNKLQGTMTLNVKVESTIEVVGSVAVKTKLYVYNCSAEMPPVNTISGAAGLVTVSMLMKDGNGSPEARDRVKSGGFASQATGS